MHLAVTEQDQDSDPGAALAELLPELRAFARFLAASRPEADDLVQEALLRALRTGAARPAEVPLRAWCLGILRNVFHERLRACRRETRLRDQPPPAPAAPDQELPSRMRDLAHALRDLPPRLREALVLVGGQGLSLPEAAAVCDVPLGTMKARVSRARGLLRKALGAVTC